MGAYERSTGIYVYTEDDKGGPVSDLLNIQSAALIKAVLNLSKGRQVGVYDAAWPGQTYRFREQNAPLLIWPIPDPGVPYRIAVQAQCELGTESNNTAARYDLWVGYRQAGTANYVQVGGHINLTAEQVFQEVTTVTIPAVLVGKYEVCILGHRVYPSPEVSAAPDGMWGELQGLNRGLRVVVTTA